MHIIKREIQIKQVDVIIENYTECDKCHCEIPDDAYDAFECQLIYKTGDTYPEGGSGKTQTIDLCKQCGKKAFALLKKKGFRINTEDWDF